MLRPFAAALLGTLISHLALPFTASALTSGPSQPEVQSFEPADTKEMVDLFSGDFVYNIPLMDVGGYPLNLAYHAGVGMDQEASWVGLGWNVNPGVINRTLRGLPDDFAGDLVKEKLHTRPNRTYGLTAGATFELFGNESLKLGAAFGVKYNNYRGVGFDLSLSPTLSVGVSSKSSLNIGLGIKSSSQDGVSVDPQVSYSYRVNQTGKTMTDLGSYVGTSFNSRAGMSQLSFGLTTSSKDQLFIAVPLALKDVSESGGLNGTHSFSSPSYSPSGNFSYLTNALTLNFKSGGSIFGSDPGAYLSGHYSQTKQTEKEIEYPSYGLLNLGKAYETNGDMRPDVMLDFNREKDGPYIPAKGEVNLTQLTGDVYSVMGQGVNGSYKATRRDVGMVWDPVSTVRSLGGSGGIELGSGNILKVGGDINVNFVDGESVPWTRQNDIRGLLKFRDNASDGNLQYEASYLKAAGEPTFESEANSEFWESMGGEKAVRIDVDRNHRARNALRGYGMEERQIKAGAENRVPMREKRNQVVVALRADEVAVKGIFKKGIPVVKRQDPEDASTTKLEHEHRVGNSTNNTYRKAHHISEIIVTRPDGMRYVYSVPAYNIKQIEASFNCVGLSDRHACNGTVDYEQGDEDGLNREKRGIDQYQYSKETPSYAYSYLLSAILSPDYVDLTGDGPTDDDLGSSTRFYYSRPTNDFKWRTPYPSVPNEREATLNEGMLSLDEDDKASYIYGVKEIWYLHSIETKTHKAFFHTSDRLDGRGVSGEHANVFANAAKQMKLDSISLFAKGQLRNLNKYRGFPEEEDEASALHRWHMGDHSEMYLQPVKTVHFEYDYSLCEGVFNNADTEDNGKLTLKKVYYSYGNLNAAAGRLNAYEFHYAPATSGAAYNPDYSPTSVDRWGSFKPNCPTCGESQPAYCTSFPSGQPSNQYFPYSEQDSAKAALYASAWNLTRIDLPTGGTIRVEYESDDYAYVQDKAAMQMFKVVGVHSSKPTVPFSSPMLYAVQGFDYVVFELDPVHAAQTPAQLRRLCRNTSETANSAFIREFYSGSIDNLYFRFKVRMGYKELYEYVSGYAELEDSKDFGLVAEGGKTYGFIKLKLVNLNDKKGLFGSGNVSPISKAAWNMGRANAPQLMYPGSGKVDGESGVVQAVRGLLAVFSNFAEVLNGGPNRMFQKSGYSADYKPHESFIRLNSPLKKKKGGGHRVKEIVISDNWGAAMGDPSVYETSEYGYRYEYTTQEDGRTISSGVASYEPILGGDENPFRKVVRQYGQKLIAAADITQLVEEPMGESFMPGASVGYSKIKVTPFTRSKIGTGDPQAKSVVGCTEYRFYTAKDFPVLFENTGGENVRNAMFKPLVSLLKIGVTDRLSVTQGYSIILNNMHGQMRGEATYDQAAASSLKKNPDGDFSPVSSTEYLYRSCDKRLVNDGLRFVDRSGKIGSGVMGVEYEMVADMRESRTDVYGAGLALNVDGFIVPLGIVPIPLAVPVPYPLFSSEHTRSRISSVTKVVMKHGILEKVVQRQQNAYTVTENILRDRETGQVVLKSMTNEYFRHPEGIPKNYFKRNEAPDCNYQDLLDSLAANPTVFSQRDDRTYSFTYPAHWAYDGMGQACVNQGMPLVFPLPDLPPPDFITNESGVINNTKTFPLGFSTSSPPKIIDYLYPGDEILCKIYMLDPASQPTTVDAVGWVVQKGSDKLLIGEYGQLLRNVISGQVIRSGRRNHVTAMVGSVETLKLPVSVDNTNPANPIFTLDFDNEDRSVLRSSAVTMSDQWAIECCGTDAKAPPATPAVFGPDIGPDYNRTFGAKCPGSNCGSATYNPYLWNALGAWRPLGQYVYQTDLKYDNKYASVDPNLNAQVVRKGGVFSTFTPFWQLDEPTGTLMEPPANLNDADCRWLKASESTLYSQYGVELETRDALGRHTAALYGYGGTLPVSVAQNARLREIAVESFEDIQWQIRPWSASLTYGQEDGQTALPVRKSDNLSCRPHPHFSFNLQSAGLLKHRDNDNEKDEAVPGGHAYVTGVESHSGLRSLAVAAGESVHAIRTVVDEADACSSGHNPDLMPRVVDECAGCIPRFAPTKDSDSNPGNNLQTSLSSPDLGVESYRYVIDAWTKVKDGVSAEFTGVYGSKIEVYALTDCDVVLIAEANPAGPVIEGWQKIEGGFVIPDQVPDPANSSNMKEVVGVMVKLMADADHETYFDDLRIHPFHATMKCFVYHPKTLQLMAELDENNYATFFEYDDRGSVIRFKKETERGVVTLRETRQHNAQN